MNDERGKAITTMDFDWQINDHHVIPQGRAATQDFEQDFGMIGCNLSIIQKIRVL